MLYDKIIESLIDTKKAIKEKFGDDGAKERGMRNYSSGPDGYDRIQYEIDRIAEAIRHTTVTAKAANKINYPSIPFDGISLDVSPPYSVHFNTVAHPVVTPPEPGAPGLYGWQVYGHPLWMFGFFTEDGVTTKAGLFEVADNEIVEIDSIYDGASWSNGGIWPVRYGVKSYPVSVGTLSGIVPATDMAIPSLGTKDLVDIADQKQDKIRTDLSEKDKVVVAHGDGGIDAITYELSSDLDNSYRKIPISRTVYQNVLAESVSRQNADIELGARLDRQEGLGGPLSEHDFGTPDPAQEQLIEYYCVGIWGGYDYDAGTFTWNPSEPKDSTYEIGGVTHTAGEIFNNTWFRNTYNGGNQRFVITNTPDTSPPVFIVTDVGVDTVAMATGKLAGIAKLYNDVEDSNTDGGVTQAAVKTALAGKQDALESGKSIKTVDGKPLLGSGNIETSAVAPVSVAVSDLAAANSDYAATGNVYKIGKLVVLNLTVKAAAASKSLSANTAYDLFTFKSGYSPNINGLNFAISLRNSNTVAAMAYTNMDSTGTFVRFKAAAAITLNDQTDIRLSAVYVAAS